MNAARQAAGRPLARAWDSPRSAASPWHHKLSIQPRVARARLAGCPLARKVCTATAGYGQATRCSAPRQFLRFFETPSQRYC